MAAPNIVNVSTIIGKTASVTLNSTSAISIVNNPASSGKVFKINTIYVANTDGSSATEVTIGLYSEDDLGGTSTELIKTVVVPPDATLIVVEKASSIYLEEDKSIGAIAGVADRLKVTCSYEEIS